MKIKEQKQGVSLIVLVITIIVMIILAATVIISLTNNGIIGKANEAVNDSNLKQIQTIASLAWSDAYMDGVRSTKGLEAAVKNKLKEAGLEENEYELNVTETGVDFQKSTTPVYYGKPYSATTNGMTMSIVAYKDGSAEVYVNKEAQQSFPAGTITYDNLNVYMGGQLYGTLSTDGKTLDSVEGVYVLDTTWCVHSSAEIINETSTYFGDFYCYECGEILSLEHNNVIPEGGTYYVGVTGTTTGDYTGGTAYTAGQNFPATVSEGDVYVYGDYEYRYYTEKPVNASVWNVFSGKEIQPGWNVIAISRIKMNYGAILGKINDISVNCMVYTFVGHQGPVNVSSIIVPNSVTAMVAMFCEVESLMNTSELKIPNSIENLDSLFALCRVESVKLPNIDYLSLYMFDGCTYLKNITVPTTVKSISQDALQGCTSLTAINYLGTIEQWKSITFDEDWNDYTGNYTIYCTNGTISKDGTVTYN